MITTDHNHGEGRLLLLAVFFSTLIFVIVLSNFVYIDDRSLSACPHSGIASRDVHLAWSVGYPLNATVTCRDGSKHHVTAKDHKRKGTP